LAQAEAIVPEPSGLALIVLGGLGLLPMRLCARRARRPSVV